MSISTKKTLCSDEVKDFVQKNKESLFLIGKKNIPLETLTVELPNYSNIQGCKVSAVKASAARRRAYKTRGGPNKKA